MANYVGEVYLAYITAQDFVANNGTFLDEDDVQGVTVAFYDIEGEQIITPQVMTYDEDRGWWFYRLDTDVENLEAGKYKAEFILTDLMDGKSIEYMDVRLKARPV